MVNVILSSVPFTDKYLFHHIVKAGGTSLAKLFDRILGPANVFHASGQYLYTPPTILAGYRMVTGHFRFTRGPYHDPSRYYITFLRDPLDRVLSAYFYYRSLPDTVDTEETRLAKRFTFEEFIDLPDPAARAVVDNHQTCWFGLADPRTYGLTGASLLRAAVEVLESYDFVGVYDYFPQSVAALCRQMGWSMVKHIPRLNKTRERARVEDLSRETRDRLLALNAMDHELYQYFKRKFESWHPVGKEEVEAASEAGAVHAAPPHLQAAVVVSKRQTSFPPGGLGSREVEIVSVSAAGENSGSSLVKAGEWLNLAVSFQSHVDSDNVNFMFFFWDEIGQLAFLYKSLDVHPPYQVAAAGLYTAVFRVKANLGMGLYTVDTAIHRGCDYQEHCYHYLANSAQFEVDGSPNGWFAGHTWLENGLTVAQVGPIDYAQSSIEVISRPFLYQAGDTVQFQVRVANHGSDPWPCSGPMMVCCSYHIFGAEKELLVWDGLRSVLPEDVAGGGEAIASVAVTLPEQPGNYTIRLTLLQEQVAWFEENGLEPADIPIEVEAPASAQAAQTVEV